MKKLPILALCLVALAACNKSETPATDTTDTTMTSAAPATDTTSSDTTAINTPTGTSAMTSTGSTSPLSEDDKKVAIAAAQANLGEVDAGNMASSKATNADVKTFAAKMVTDHTTANDQLKNWANAKGIALPTETDDEHKKTAADLSKKSGADFDRSYMDAMVKGHTKVASDLEAAKTKVTDADLRTWIDNTLPVVQGHLQMAKDIRAKLK